VHDDASRSILSRNASPDVGFSVSLNPYRGCEHGCAYCYARPTHEYLGLSAGLDFEREIFVKRDAAALLRRALAAPSWVPEPIALSGVTDPYQPLERRERVTCACLEVLAEHRQPVSLITKNQLVTRDLDLLSELARHRAVAVTISITTLDDDLRASMEPRTSSPTRRLAAIRTLADAGVPVGVNVAPVIPGLTDAEIPAILGAAADAGASFAGTVVLRLPHAVEEVFLGWLETLDPARARRVLARVREIRGGRLNDPAFGSRMRGTGTYAEQIRSLYRLAARRHGLERRPSLSSDAFRVPGRVDQPRLFEG
jgi:DNA repair photolyase